jgi:hypothetical protein
MKKTLLTLLSVLFCAITFAQSVPQGINYQAVARDANGAVLMNQTLTIQFSVISDITTIPPTISWQETHTVSTNDYGLYTAIIGGGTTTSVGSSATFDVIDWGASNHLLKVEVDFGSGYLDMGTTAFMSVPYALYGEDEDADSNNELQSLSISGDTLFISSGNSIVISGLSLINSLIVQGCTDVTAFIYNAAANTDDGSCIAVVNGCTDSTAFNYNPLANTDDGSCTYPLAIGDTHQGGIVFYLDGNGGGLIAATSDQSSAAEWGCYGTLISGADGTAIGTGNQNTIDIEAGCTTPGTAADICANLTLGGYSDWFLPSKDELNEMYLNIGQGNALGLGNIGGFANYGYWSSTEVGNYGAWGQDFDSGFQGSIAKLNGPIFRAVRAFTSNNVLGCTDSTACNYDPLANNDDGSCGYISGCTDSTVINFNSLATCDDGSCTYPSAPAIGDTYQGGIVFWLDGNGGGLIAAPLDQSNAEWGCLGTLISGADGMAIGTGAQNTIDIVNANCSPYSSGNLIAADICANYTDGTYSDWFLPSKDELNQMYVNLHQQGLGGFASFNYWSSTEGGSFNAWLQNFFSGSQGNNYKSTYDNVRAVRAF